MHCYLFFQLLPGDQIWQVNGEDVKLAPREHVIQLVRACSTTVTLTVCQPTEQQGARKSTLLSASKRARLKTKPSRVRFAESVCVNGAPLFPVRFPAFLSLPYPFFALNGPPYNIYSRRRSRWEIYASHLWLTSLRFSWKTARRNPSNTMRGRRCTMWSAPFRRNCVSPLPNILV